MKFLNINNLSYCALILLFNTVTSIPSDGDHLQPPSSHGLTHNLPSWFSKHTTDPSHAFWRKRSPGPAPSPTDPITFPTKCQYVAPNTDEACTSGCICKTGCASLYIWNATRALPKPQYHICTNWMLNYKFQISSALLAAGFEIPLNRTRCGWQSFSHVSAMRVGRASVDVNGTVEEQWGSPGELERIEEVLRGEYPFVEILLICATLVGPIFMFFGGVGWCIWADRERKVRYRPVRQKM